MEGMKGFVLTLDAMTAVILISFVLSFTALELTPPTHTSQLPRMAQDYLSVLEKTGTFYDLNEKNPEQAQDQIDIALNMMLPHMGGRLTVNLYTMANSTFLLNQTIISLRGNEAEHKTVVQRAFITNDYTLYGIATLEAWYE